MRSVVQFKVHVPVAKGAGYDDQFFDFGSTRGYLKARSGGRSLDFGEVNTTNQFELYIRYQPYYARVDLRIVIEGRQFTIDTVTSLEEGKNQWLKFIINEKKIDA